MKLYISVAGQTKVFVPLQTRLVHDLKNVFYLIQKHDFLGGIDLWPEFQKSHYDIFRQRRILFQELHNAICQLRMIQR